MDLWILRIWKGLLMGLKRRTDAVSGAWRQAIAVARAGGRRRSRGCHGARIADQLAFLTAPV